MTKSPGRAHAAREQWAMDYKHVIVETHGSAGLVTLNRPAVLNALCFDMLPEIRHALDTFEADDAIGAVVITGNAQAFAAGADIKAMAQLESFAEVFAHEFAGGDWLRIASCRKPVIAAVAGYALGGGCELALMCDFIYAADNAKFGQPEITVGTTPGCGGTQRLPRAIGKAKAMEMCLTGRFMDAREAEQAGLVARVFPVESLVQEALNTAQKIAGMSRPVAMLVKECVNRAYETSLNEGSLFERRAYHACFSLADRKEAMQAFVDKRKPRLKNA
jgi:enoyl-CoA hydratase